MSEIFAEPAMLYASRELMLTLIPLGIVAPFAMGNETNAWLPQSLVATPGYLQDQSHINPEVMAAYSSLADEILVKNTQTSNVVLSNTSR